MSRANPAYQDELHKQRKLIERREQEWLRNEEIRAYRDALTAQLLAVSPRRHEAERPSGQPEAARRS